MPPLETTALTAPALLGIAERVSGRLLTVDDETEVLRGVLEELRAHLPVTPSGQIIRLDRNLNSVESLAASGGCSACLGCQDTIRLGGCLCGIAVTTESLVYSLSSDEDTRHTVPSDLDHGHVVVPVAVDPARTYLLVFYLPEQTRLDGAHLGLFNLAARMAVLALQRFDRTDAVGPGDASTPSASRAGDLPPRRILVVEDESSLRTLMVKTLRVLGCEATGIADGSELGESLSSFEPDAVLLDWNLGDRDARQALDDLRRRGLPVVIITGDPDVVGPVDVPVIGKPVDLDTLCRVLREV